MKTQRYLSENTRIRISAAGRTALIYSLLAVGSAVFTLPFLWMLSSSYKVDSEMFAEGIRFLPGKPMPQPQSPYFEVDELPDPNDELYRQVTRVIRQASDEAVLVPAVYRRLQQILPRTVWELEEVERTRIIKAQLTPEFLRGIRSHAERRLMLGPVRIRSQELQETEVSADRPLNEFWTIVEGPAELLNDKETGQAILAYDFTLSEKQRVVLSASFTTPFAADRLHRVMVSITPDNSWHALHFELRINGRLYQTIRPEYTGEVQPRIVVLQERSEQDDWDSTMIRFWSPYRHTGDIPRDEGGEENEVELIVTLVENGQMEAWWAKFSRNYRKVFTHMPFWKYASISSILVVLNIIGSIFSCSFAAYAFSRLEWPGRKLAFALMMATLMIPPQVTLIPYFLIIKSLGWYNTLNPLWILSFTANAFNTFLLIQFMRGIPKDLESAALIDGCNFLQIYWHVILPLIKPTLACIGIFTFLAVWNDFMGPLIFISDQRLYPLSLGLYALQVEEGTDIGMMMAAALLVTLPIIVLFFFAQKYFIQGISLTGIKG